MLAALRTAALFGVEACPVHVEVDVSFGMPGFTMVGLPDTSVRESRDRVRSAIRNSGFEFPPHRITVNLAPADVRKAGASFDLPIALGILAAQGVVERRQIADLVLLGELSLDGSIHATRGVLPIAAAARRDGLSGDSAAGCERRRGRDRGRPRRPRRSRRWPTRSGAQPPIEHAADAGPRHRRSFTSTGAPICPTCAASCWRAARSRLPPPADTTCCWSARRAPARR